MNMTSNFRPQLVLNEIQLKHKNQKGKNAVKKLAKGDDRLDPEALWLPFKCECSDKACGAVITLKTQDYEKIHERKDQFIVAPGHELPSIEQVVQTHPDYLVVRKFDLPK